ncbi:MAG TPA: hypothetical protein VKQ05_08315 [Gemmatimonadales bacterium]|nr:hypothetical protein [Gemmatimonadales bacterium]
MHQTRTILILSALLVACIVALYFGAQWFQRELADKPYVAEVKAQLRALGATEETFHRDSLTYTDQVFRVWTPGAGTETQGVQLRILSATKDGLLAEGRHDGWKGRCVIALGMQARDSLPPGEPICYWKGG